MALRLLRVHGIMRQYLQANLGAHMRDHWVTNQFEEADKIQARLGVRLNRCRFRPKRQSKAFSKEERHDLYKRIMKVCPFKPKF